MVNNDQKLHKITTSIEQKPSCEDNRSSASQEIPRMLWNPKVHYRVSQEPVTCPYPEPQQSNPRPHFLNICFNFILPSTHRSSKRSLSLGFPNQNALCTYPPHTCCMPCPGHLILIDLITRVIFGAVNRSWSSLVCSFLHSASPVSSSHLGPHIFLSALLCSSSVCTCGILKVLSLYETFDINSFYRLACLLYNTCY